MSTARRTFPVLGILVGVTASVACSTQDKLNRTLDEIYKLAKNGNDGIDNAKSLWSTAPKVPGSGQSVNQGRSGGGLPAATAQGETGSVQSDVNGDGTDETVTGFTDSTTGTTYYSASFNDCDAEGDCRQVCITWWEDESGLNYVTGTCGSAEYARCSQAASAPEPSCVACDDTGCGNSSYSDFDAQVSEPSDQDAQVAEPPERDFEIVDPSAPDSDFVDPSDQDADVSGGGENSCPFAFDGECDEPNACAPGTDTADCLGGGGQALYIDCAALNGCLEACSDDDCISSCFDDASPEALSAYRAAVECLDANGQDASACLAELSACE